MFRQLLSCKDGELSTMRVSIMLLVLYAIMQNCVIISIWAWICIKKEEFIPMTITDVSTTLGSLATIPVALLAKAKQLGDE